MHTAQKMKFFIEDFFSKCADLDTFTEEILNEKLIFLCSGTYYPFLIRNPRRSYPVKLH